MENSGVRVALIKGEPCDFCNLKDERIVYAFKFKEPLGTWSQLWLHKNCLAELTEKLWMMEAKFLRAGGK